MLVGRRLRKENEGGIINAHDESRPCRDVGTGCPNLTQHVVNRGKKKNSAFWLA